MMCQPRTAKYAWLLCAIVACAVCSGCREEQRIEDAYGRRSRYGAEISVNGTRVLGEMFEDAGHRVFSWGRLSPRLWQRADCIVWFPDDFEPPSDEVCDWLEYWLQDEPGRVLIYVGRDFDAEPWYWDEIESQVPQGQREAFEKYRDRADEEYASDRKEFRTRQESRWFNVDPQGAKRMVQTLAGDAEWLKEIAPEKLGIELRSRFEPSEYAEVLLESKGDMLVSREKIADSEIYVVTNGSFLLNLPLVNHEHRKLAGKLIDVVPGEKRTVVFLESGYGGPKIQDEDPFSGMPTGNEIFNIWPTNWILLHLAIVGILFCFWRFPIFGLARPGESDGLSDFGKHLDAVAELLRQSGDTKYARRRMKEYLRKIKPNE